MIKKSMYGILFFLFCVFFSPLATAQQVIERQGIDLKAAVTTPVLFFHSRFKDLEVNAGIGLSLVLGYRWYHGGLYIDQDFNNIYVKDIDGKLDTSFMGSFYFTFRNFYAFHSRAQIYASMGIGFVYGSQATRKIVGLSEYQVAVSVKGELGISYAINDIVGVGFDLVYAYATVDEKILSVIIMRSTHILTPSIHLNFYL